MSPCRSRSAIAVTAAAVLALCAALTGCSAEGTADQGKHSAQPRVLTSQARGATSQPATARSRPASSSQAKPALSPRQQAGQRVIYSYPGKTVPKSLLERIREGRVAGVIFFGENITSSNQIASVIKRLKAANAKSPVQEPLLLLTDQEGGQIRRLPGAPSSTPKQDGSAKDPLAASRKAGTSAGRNLANVGMNLNAAPVLGVYRKPGDYLDRFGRSFSNDPKQVAGDAAAFIRGQQGAGVTATAKHFPGLGSASAKQDTDQGPVTLNTPLSTLRKVDEAPYPKAFAADTKVVMPSWAVYPAIDPNRPAGLSAKVLKSELRDRLGFRGVTMSDALEAKALKAYGSSGKRAVTAAEAGMDLILASGRSVEQGDQAAAALRQGSQSGQLDKGAFDASVNRIGKLRKSVSG